MIQHRPRKALERGARQGHQSLRVKKVFNVQVVTPVDFTKATLQSQHHQCPLLMTQLYWIRREVLILSDLYSQLGTENARSGSRNIAVIAAPDKMGLGPYLRAWLQGFKLRQFTAHPT